MDKIEAILSATNYGLDIILRYYPQAAEALARKKHFKLREDEKTASASIKLFGNKYIIKDFGSGKSLNCFEIVMDHERLDFSGALDFICRSYTVPGLDLAPVFFEAELEFRAADPEEKEGERSFSLKDEITDTELKQLFSDNIYRRYKEDPKRLRAVCQKYGLFSMNSYTVIKSRKATIVKSTEHYPIFMWDFGEFKKIYQPKAKDKARRFFSIGDKPDKFICGLKQLEKAFTKREQEILDDETDSVEGSSPKKRNPKLKRAFMVSGGSDALNVAAVSPEENFPIWMNSESERINQFDFLKIKAKVEDFYSIPDIDDTGIAQGHAFAMEFLEVKTVWLPEELRLHRDFRGNKCKDVKDFFKFYKIQQFDDILKVALPFQFWDLEPKFDKDRNFKKYEYQFNNLHAYNFLYKNGFCRFKDKNAKEGYIFTKIEGDVVKEVLAGEIKDYINNFLEDRKADTDLRNMVFRTTQVKESSMGNLPVRDIEFRDFEKDCQYMFFLNKTWKISKREIEEFKTGVVNRYVWDDEVIKHEVKKLDDFFKVEFHKDTDRFSIEILNTDCMLFRFLINTANMHWRVKEYGVKDPDTTELRYKLTPEEDYENQLHLINRLYTLGYLMHRYKDPDKAWAPYFMENKVTEESISNGGSGKSICASIPSYFMKHINLNGRNPDLLDNNHWNENITEHIDLVHFEDTHQYMKLDELFNIITGDFPVNPKHSKGYFLPYEVSPKLVFSSNFALKNLDQSSRRRLLFSVLSDYYHHGPNDEFESARTPSTEFGKNLFRDFDENEWNMACNLIAQCIKLHLSIPKIDPPMANVEKRNLVGIMGDQFLDWAEVFFSKAAGRLNANVVREQAFNDFILASKLKWSSNKFKSAVKAFCKYKEYTFNPKDLCNDDHDRIIGSHYDEFAKKMVSKEMFHIRTADIPVQNEAIFVKDLKANISGIVQQDEEGGLPF